MARILVVEDNEELAQTLADWLTFEGHEVVLAYDGLEATNHIDAINFDLILLDWVMPGRSGIDVCRNYRMAGGTAPVIMLTGKVSLDNKEIGFDAGVDDYIVKPFNLKELSWRMRSWLRRSFRTFPVVMPSTIEKQEVTLLSIPPSVCVRTIARSCWRRQSNI
jgi:two-component system, OmpR family, manganese sensing response regulator